MNFVTRAALWKFDCDLRSFLLALLETLVGEGSVTSRSGEAVAMWLACEFLLWLDEFWAFG